MGVYIPVIVCSLCAGLATGIDSNLVRSVFVTMAVSSFLAAIDGIASRFTDGS